ncbi:MAG: M55 family metallopeptidase [Solirubrobacterales bacterium]
MNVLVATDMEGIGGIDDYRECLPSHPAAYARGCRLMTDEALAAVEALRAGGAERISIGDWHMVGTNVERERAGGARVRPIAELALVEDEPSMSKAHGGPLDAVVLIGHHAGTRNRRGFSSHTFLWEMEVTLDGEQLNEVQVYAQALAAEGIPVLVAGGDRWMLEELGSGELGGARLLATKEGQGRARACSYDLRSTRADLVDAIAAAMAAPPAPPPARAYPAELRIAVEGEELARTRVDSAGDLLGRIATAFRASPGVSREYRQLAGLLPADSGSPLRQARRWIGSVAVTPVMLAKERSWLRAAPA